MQQALTIRGNGFLPAIVSQVGVSIPFLGDPSQQAQLIIQPFQAIWDTGATNSVITDAVVQSLMLKPTGQTVAHTASGPHTTNTYLVNLALPGNVMVQGVRVTEGKLSNGVDVLIGMDIITKGDFSITNANQKTVMSFRIPSQEEIDYIPQVNQANESSLLQGMNRQQRRQYEAQKRKNK